MKYLYTFLLILALGSSACFLDRCNDPAGPDPIPTDPDHVEPEPEPEEPKRVDRKPPLHNLHVFTFFSATITYDAEIGYKTQEALEQQYITRVARYMMEKGFNTARIGAQTDGWCDNGVFYLPCGPPVYSDEWRENLVGMLEVTSRIRGLYVQLIPTFTWKSGMRKGELEKLTRTVVRIAEKRGYKHIVWEAFNEFVHPGTRAMGNLNPSTLRTMLEAIPHPRGTDLPDNGKAGDDWRGVMSTSETGSVARYCDYIAWHPSRNPEPTAHAYRQTMNKTGLPVVFDETVSWISQHERTMVKEWRGLYTKGSEKEMRRQVNKQQQNLCEAGATCSFHALWLFSYDERIDWAPTCPCP